jgi:hypothetical protein
METACRVSYVVDVVDVLGAYIIRLRLCHGASPRERGCQPIRHGRVSAMLASKPFQVKPSEPFRHRQPKTTDYVLPTRLST